MTNARDLLLHLEGRNYWRRHVTAELIWLGRFNALYAACSKNASSRTKTLLADALCHPARFDGDPHKAFPGFRSLRDLDDATLDRALLGDGTFRFAFVRDPYARAESCFLSRVDRLVLEPYDDEEGAMRALVQRRRQILAWKTGEVARTIDTTREITFRDFIAFICQQDPFDMDRHWYHQTRSIQFGYIRYDRIGRLETFHQDMRDILDRIGVPHPDSEGERGRNASERGATPSLFDRDTAAMFHAKFEEDFDNFRYPRGLAPFPSASAKATRSGAEPSPGDPRIEKDMAIVVTGRVGPGALRRFAASVRAVYPGVRICVSVSERYKGIYEEIGARYDLDIRYLAGATSDASIRNQMVSSLTEAYILFCRATHVFRSTPGLDQALNLLRQQTELLAAGGIVERIVVDRDDKPLDREWRSDAFYIGGEIEKAYLVYLPLEYVDPPRFQLGDGFYACSDTLSPFSLWRREALVDAGIRWDEQLVHGGEHEELFLRLHLDAPGARRFAFCSRMVVEEHVEDPAAGEDGDAAHADAALAMERLGLRQVIVFGSHIDYRRAPGAVARVPFRDMDAIRRAGRLAEDFVTRYVGMGRNAGLYPAPTAVSPRTERTVKKPDKQPAKPLIAKLLREADEASAGGRPFDALASFLGAAALASDGSDLHGRALRGAAEALVTMGQFRLARETLRSAIGSARGDTKALRKRLKDLRWTSALLTAYRGRRRDG